MTTAQRPTDQLRLLAAEDQATAAAAPLLQLDVARATGRQLDAARPILGEAKRAIRRTAYAVDGGLTGTTLARLRPYTAVLAAIWNEEDLRLSPGGRAFRRAENAGQ